MKRFIIVLLVLSLLILNGCGARKVSDSEYANLLCSDVWYGKAGEIKFFSSGKGKFTEYSYLADTDGDGSLKNEKVLRYYDFEWDIEEDDTLIINGDSYEFSDEPLGYSDMEYEGSWHVGSKVLTIDGCEFDKTEDD